MVFAILLVGSVTAAYALTNYEYVDDFGKFGILYEGTFSHPQHIAADSEGILYITDIGNKRIQKFAPDGTYLDQWGRSGSGNSEFHEPTGIAINQDLVYVVDRDLNRIQVFDLDGKYISQWGSRGIAEGQFKLPTGIAIGLNGTVYVADSGNQRIQMFSPNGTLIGVIGTSGSGVAEFLHLVNVETDSAGNVYGVDKGNSKIEKFDSYGNHTQTIKFDANNWIFSPQSLSIAPDDSMFILNSVDNKILHLDQDAHLTLRISEQLGPFDNYLSMGTDLLLADTGHLYVVDSLGHRVYKHNTPFLQKPVSVPDVVSEPSNQTSSASTNQTLPEPVSTNQTLSTLADTKSSAVVSGGCGLSMDAYNVIIGTEQSDILEGTDGIDLIFALGGNDIVSGYGGNDCIFGGSGDDIIFGNDGSDGIFGDEGNDILKGSAGNDVIYGNYGLDYIDGGDGTDVCAAADAVDQDVISNCES